MKNNVDKILLEIEQIIAKIGNYDIGKLQLSSQGRKELSRLFRQKVVLAKTIKKQNLKEALKNREISALKMIQK
ncbi:MAG TPA: hypothetical protein ENJ44_05065 [Oceanospirillales bacterium]|nr:hypothetical protein [Oceanospirillales bacterium]